MITQLSFSTKPSFISLTHSISIQQRSEPTVHYPILDGLRGFACLIVVFTHNFGFTNYFFFGWFSVDLFFVISGFLITRSLLQTKEQSHYFRNFYFKRILRIFPLYYLTLIFFFWIVPHINNFPIDMNYYVANQWWFWTYLQNWFIIFKTPGNATNVIQHFWSLAVEEQFYLVWPWIILLIKKPKNILAFTAFLLLAVIALRFLVWALQIKGLNYQGLYNFTRIDGICAGSMLAILWYNGSRFLEKNLTTLVFVLAGFNFLFFFFNQHYHFTFPYLAIVGYATFAVLFALLVYESVKGRNKILNLFFGNTILRFVGKISFSYYILHWPVFKIFYSPVYDWLDNHSSFSDYSVKLITSSLLTIAGFFISICSYYGFERHFLKMKKVFN